MADESHKEVKKRQYKGEVMPISKVPTNSIIQTIKHTFKNSGYSGKLPTFLIVKHVAPGWSKATVALSYYAPSHNFSSRTISINADHEVNVLTGRQAAKLAQEFEEWSAKHVGERAVRETLSLGADPEMFAVNAKGGVIPAWDWLPSKAKPLVLGSGAYTGSNGYWDGFQAEFDTRAHSCLAYFCDNLQAGLRGLHNAARAYDKGAKLSLASVLPVDPEVLATGKEEHVQFGCMPSLNAYGLKGRGTHGREVPFRFAGGHIHFGFHKPADAEKRIAHTIKAMDAILGVACVSLFQSFDNPIRREYYGQPGEYRLPAHGLEYRSLTNAWLSHPAITNLTYELARRAFSYGWNNCTGWKADEAETIDVMMKCDVVGAHKILNRNKSAFMSLVKTTSAFLNSDETVWRVVMGGMEEAIKEPTDIAANWKLDGPWLGHCEGTNMMWCRAADVLKGGKKL